MSSKRRNNTATTTIAVPKRLPFPPPIKLRIWSTKCGKWKYIYREHAEIDVEDQHQSRKDRKNKGRNMNLCVAVYACPHCDGYHMTHKEQFKPRTKRKVKK